MATALKDLYSSSFYDIICKALGLSLPNFDKRKFLRLIYSEEFVHMELKQRMNHTAKVLHEFMPADYAEAVDVLKAIIDNLKKLGIRQGAFEYIFLADYIEQYGFDDYDNSVRAIEIVTQFISCEFAVRPFLVKYEPGMIKQMLEWSKHEHAGVRRLSSEGIRPRLPWGKAVPSLKKDPSPILPILENLKTDQSESVRRSVANNLNDIAKDHPDVVISIASKWKGISKETDAIIKHGCRTLLKKGHTDVLRHFDLDSSQLELSKFVVSTKELRIGEYLEFSFAVKNNSTSSQRIRLEYAIYYKLKNGEYSRKVFKISESNYPAAAKLTITRKQSFRPITTRTYYKGNHKVSVILNGKESASKKFVLI